MNIPSIFSQSSLLTPKSFKEELTSLYNIVSNGKETMDKLWVLYWIVANLVQDDPVHELCNRLMVKGYLDQDETNDLNLALVELHIKTVQEDFNDILKFSSTFYETELLAQVISENFLDVLVVDFLDEVYEDGEYHPNAFEFAKTVFSFQSKESEEENSEYIKHWIESVSKTMEAVKYHGIKLHHRSEIDRTSKKATVLTNRSY